MMCSTTADRLVMLAGDILAIASDYRVPARTIQDAERRVAEVERIAGAVRAVVRGSGAQPSA